MVVLRYRINEGVVVPHYRITEGDRHVTYDGTHVSLHISWSENLAIDGSWKYLYELETKQQSTIWVFQNENLATKAVRWRSISKQIIARFIAKSSQVARKSSYK